MYAGPFLGAGYVLGDKGGDDAHIDCDGGLVQVRHLFVFDDVRGKDVDDENDDEDECLNVKSLCTHGEKLFITIIYHTQN